MLSTDDLKLKYGNVVRTRHKVTLNQLTKTLNRDQTIVNICAHLQASKMERASKGGQHGRRASRPQLQVGSSASHLSTQESLMLSQWLVLLVG